MSVVTFAKIRAFTISHSDSDVALREWFKKTEQSNWNNFSDVKQTFNSVDSVGNNRFVFNVKGNTYRLVVLLLFASQKVYIRFIGTHSEYDKIDCKNV